MAILRFLQKWMKSDLNRPAYKNHFNFRLHVEIDTIKQTDKNNDHIHRNKTNKPVNPSLHKLAGNTHFCTHTKCHWLGMKPFLDITKIVIKSIEYFLADTTHKYQRIIISRELYNRNLGWERKDERTIIIMGCNMCHKIIVTDNKPLQLIFKGSLPQCLRWSGYLRPGREPMRRL